MTLNKIFFFFLLIATKSLLAINEKEPNGSFSQANSISQDSTVIATINASNEDDYFVSVSGSDGTIKIYFNYSGGSSGADFYLTAYNSAKVPLGNKTVVNKSSSQDSLTIYCRAADTIYFNFTSNEAVSYRFSYKVIVPAKNDIEPNNTFSQATFFPNTATVQGRIAYNTKSADGNDYYYSILPDDGTLRIIIDKNNTSNSSGADFYFYAYNKKKSSIGSLVKVNTSLGAAPTDTLNIYCRSADTVYFMIDASVCYTYSFRYEVIPSGVKDIEPNNSFAQATFFAPTQTVQGRIAYNSAGVEQKDYYYSVLPDDGTLRVIIDKNNVSNSAGANFYFDVFNKSNQNIGSLTSINTSRGTQPTDTLDIFCRSADTVYFLVDASTCYSYSFRFVVVPSGVKDAEPNNSFAQATYFAPTQTVQGRVSYKSIGAEQKDYFYSVLPSDGTLRIIIDKTNISNSTGADFYFDVYNKSKANIGSLVKVNTARGILPTDTLEVFCRAADTVYFLVEGSTCYSYSFRYSMISTWPSDIEPNNSLVTAKTITLTDTVKGKVGYSSSQVDQSDYYRYILTERSMLTTYLNFNNTSNSAGADFYIYFLNKKGGNIRIKGYVNQSRGNHSDSIMVNCLPGDTLYIRFYSPSQCFSYNATFKLKSSQPIVKILAAQTGNEYGFVARTENVNTLEWNFDNGVKSNLKHVSQIFKLGGYKVMLQGKNTVCNLIEKDSMLVTVRGIERYIPQKAGVGGDVMMQIYGGGLDTNVKVTLTKGSSILVPKNKSVNKKGNVLSAEFDLHLVDSGKYDVTIVLPGESPIIFTEGFLIQKFSYPFCKAEVIGPDRWRINRATTFNLNITNSGNVNANMVVVGFVYPANVDVKLIPKQSRLNRNATTVITEGSETFSLSNAATANFGDSASKPVRIDSLLGEPFDGYMLYLIIPKVPQNATVSMPFTATTKTSGNPFFYTYTHHPNMYGSCQNAHWANTTNMIMAEGIDALDVAASQTKSIPAKAFTKSLKIGQKHLANTGALMGAHFDAWWNGYEVTPEMYGMLSTELDEANAYMYQTATDEIGTAMFEAGVGKVLKNNAIKNEWWNKTMANNANVSPESFDNFINQINALNNSGKRLETLGKMLKNVKDLKTVNEKIAALQKMKDDCPELAAQIDELLNLTDEELSHKNPNKKKTRSVQSMDPNEIYGPEGILVPRFMKNGDALHYMITCENHDTATAPAQFVTITDTLNPAHFDLSTFSFGNVFIGTKSMRLLSGRNEFYGEVSLYPEIPLYAKVVAKLDTNTGVITWSFIGIDTATGDLPIDPDLGLLPPNIKPPFGEAGVNYSVKLRKDIANGTRVKNTASIIFDENDPIITNTWSNVIDLSPPTSAITKVYLENTKTIKLLVSTADGESGVSTYKVYTSVDGGPWFPIGSETKDTLTIVGESLKQYRFYVSAEDNVGNRENKTPKSEGQINTLDINEKLTSEKFTLFPNPGTGKLSIVSSQTLTNCLISINNIMGQVVLTLKSDLYQGKVANINITPLPAGIYLIKFGENAQTVKYIKLGSE